MKVSKNKTPERELYPTDTSRPALIKAGWGQQPRYPGTQYLLTPQDASNCV